MTSRREFITLLGSAAVAWPVGARAQQAVPVIGWLGSGRYVLSNVTAFRQGLGEAGYIEGRNVEISVRHSEGQYDRLPGLISEMLQRPIAVFAAMGAPAAVAAKVAITTTPVVFFMGEDPVSLGIVPSLNRPGGNITGVALLSSTLVAKRLELLRELLPKAVTVAILVNPANPNANTSVRDAQDAAERLGQRIHVLNASSGDEIDAAFAETRRFKSRCTPDRAGWIVQCSD